MKPTGGDIFGPRQRYLRTRTEISLDKSGDIRPQSRTMDRQIKYISVIIPPTGIVYKKIHGAEVVYNALLLQAKKLNGNTDSIYHHKIGYNDMHQLFLYTHWPKFIYRKANNLNGRKRSVIPKAITAGAQYLLIDRNAVCTPFWCAMPNDILVASKCLASQLVDFIEFQTGRTFVKSAPRDSWSQMIWDLLEISFQSVFNKPKYGYVKASRTSDEISDFLDLPQKLTLSDNNNVGIPILCIQSEEKEGNDELK